MAMPKNNGRAIGKCTANGKPSVSWPVAMMIPSIASHSFDLSGYLSDTLLRDTDAMSMAHSLEVRVPLIDHHVVERLATIPGNVKLRPDAPKWLLVKAVGDLPATLVDRPKRGFEFPFKKWLLGALREEAREALSSSNLQSLLQLGVQQALWERFEDGRISWTRVWSLWVLSKYIGEIEAL